MTALAIVGFWALLAVAYCCFRVSRWFRDEADYWGNVALLVRLDPALDAVYRPELEWVRAHRSSLWEKLGGWLPPRDRQSRAEVVA